jgi:hypothetical protein
MSPSSLKYTMAFGCDVCRKQFNARLPVGGLYLLAWKWSKPVMKKLIVALSVLVLAACANHSSGSDYGTGDSSLAAANPGGGPIDPFLTNGQAVLRALDAIAQKSGKPLRITSISADEMNGLMVDAQEPTHHINVDHYVVAPDGTLSGPTPVKLMSLGGEPITATTVDARTFDPNAIAFARLRQTAREAIAKSGYPDARVKEWEFDGLGPDDRDYIYLDSARARPVAVVTPQMRIVTMRF